MGKKSREKRERLSSGKEVTQAKRDPFIKTRYIDSTSFSQEEDSKEPVLAESSNKQTGFGEPEPVDSNQYASSYPQLLDKHIFRGSFIRILYLTLCFSIIAIIGYDIYLNAWNAWELQPILWTLTKCLVVSAILIVLMVLYKTPQLLKFIYTRFEIWRLSKLKK
jgi:hypothetical protein